MTYSLEHVGVGDEAVPCVVRQDDGGYLTLNDTNALIELKEQDKEAYLMVMALVRKLADDVIRPHLTA